MAISWISEYESRDRKRLAKWRKSDSLPVPISGFRYVAAPWRQESITHDPVKTRWYQLGVAPTSLNQRPTYLEPPLCVRISHVSRVPLKFRVSLRVNAFFLSAWLSCLSAIHHDQRPSPLTTDRSSTFPALAVRLPHRGILFSISLFLFLFSFLKRFMAISVCIFSGRFIYQGTRTRFVRIT